MSTNESVIFSEGIEWREESVESASYSDSYGFFPLLLVLWHVPTDSQAGVVLGQKGKDGEWWIDAYSKDGILDPMWKVKYWADLPQGPDA